MVKKAGDRRGQEWKELQFQLRKVLAKYGKISETGGDFWLHDKDDGAYVHTVNVFNKSSLTPDIIGDLHEALWEVLEGSKNDNWEVHLLLGTSDGVLLKPKQGLKITLYSEDWIPAVKYDPADVKELDDLYKKLSKILTRYGISDAFGNGDFWIVADGWVPHSHKVCIWRIEFITPQLAEEIRQLLKKRFPKCVVWCQIEVREPGVDVPLPGIRIFADRIQEDWDIERLRSIFKDRFAFGNK